MKHHNAITAEAAPPPPRRVKLQVELKIILMHVRIQAGAREK